MYITRELEAKIKPFLKRKETLAIVGPRQAGKTTLLTQIAKKLKAQKKKVKFITFEKKSERELFQDNIEDFKKLYQSYQYIIIDEFQYASEGGQKLKYLFDTTKIKFIISGSSSLDLTFQTGKYMVGRLFSFELLPFSFREFLHATAPNLYNLLEKNIKWSKRLSFRRRNGFGSEINQRLAQKLEEYVIYGGYPQVVLTANKEAKEKVLESIAENYLLKDIKGLLALATENELWQLQKFLAAQIGNLLNYTELSNISNLKYKNLLKHLQILEKTYIIKLLPPFFVNRRLELSKNPKVYFFDLGLRNYLLNDFRAFAGRLDQGQLMENYAFTALEKIGLGKNLKYWRTKSKAEVDFVLEKEQALFPIEVKYTSKRIVGKSLYSFIEKFKPARAIVLTKDYLAEEKINNCRLQFIPLSYF